MACINVDGTLTTSAKNVIRAALEPVTVPEIALKANLPVFRVRSSLRELVEAGLLEEVAGKYQVTDTGRQKIA